MHVYARVTLCIVVLKEWNEVSEKLTWRNVHVILQQEPVQVRRKEPSKSALTMPHQQSCRLRQPQQNFLDLGSVGC